MRILHINCNYICTALHQLMIKKLNDMGYENQVFVPTYDKELSIIESDENVIVSECFKKWDRLVFDYKQEKIYRSLEKLINIKKFDCIHAYTLFTDGNCARRLSKKYNIPYVVAVRNTDVNSFFKLMPHLRSRGVRIMKEAEAVFFLSESYCRQVFSRYVPEKYHDELMKKVHIIPNGIDEFWHNNLSSTQNRVLSKDEIKLVFAGKIDRNKNIETTQKAMEIMRTKGYNAKLTVVGKIVDKGVFESIKEDKNTQYLPQMDKNKLIDVYRDNDIFVMPSYTESFGLVYVEAISQGLPVVYSKGQGFDNQFAEGEVGYSADSYSAESVADSIIKIVDNYEVITNNISSNSKNYNWESICQKYSGIYQKINVVRGDSFV